MSKRGKHKWSAEQSPQVVPVEQPPAAPAEPATPYDAMPEVVEDAGAVFKMAFLDAERGRLQTRILLTKQEGEANIRAMQLQYQTALSELQRQVRDVERRLKEHKDCIEAKYKISLRAYTYDDETGVLTKQVIETETAGGKEEGNNGH